jgi:hypothetical protein
MSPEPAEGQVPPGLESVAIGRTRFGIILTFGVVLIAAGFSYFGTRDGWVTRDRRTGAPVLAAAADATDPAWDLELPEGPHQAEFQTSCLSCHSARLPLGQPPFRREKWVEIVHKMVDAFGAPLNREQELEVVDYLIAVRPPRK